MIFIDADVVKVRDGQVRNKPFYVAVGVTVNGERDILGIWVGDGCGGREVLARVLTEIKNRGVEDVLIAVCDGLKGLPESINTSHDVGARRGADVRHSPDPQHVQVRVSEVLGPDRP